MNSVQPATPLQDEAMEVEEETNEEKVKRVLKERYLEKLDAAIVSTTKSHYRDNNSTLISYGEILQKNPPTLDEDVEIEDATVATEYIQMLQNKNYCLARYFTKLHSDAVGNLRRFEPEEAPNGDDDDESDNDDEEEEVVFGSNVMQYNCEENKTTTTILPKKSTYSG